MSDKISQSEILKEYYLKNPNRNIPHPEIVDWVTSEYKKRTGKVFRDPDRGIRKLHQEGFLIKASKGVYRYDPKFVKNRNFEEFTEKQKRYILKRDGYKCVVCGRGEREGVELHVDHIRAREYGGKATIENGQTLCGQHNYQKKILKQTETGKKMFNLFYKIAKKNKDTKLLKFFTDILQTYEKHEINCHIEWER